MPSPQNLPELLQARLRLGLLNWGKRTVTWTIVLGLLTAVAPGLKFLLIAWLLFSVLSLATLMLGLKLAKNLHPRSTSPAAPSDRTEPRDVGGSRPDSLPEKDYTSSHGHTGRNAAPDEIIEIEVEVLPPDPPR